MVKRIESTSNPIVKAARKLRDKNDRHISGIYMVEGENTVAELLAYKKELVQSLFITSKYAPEYQNCDFDVYEVTDRVMDYMCDTKTPQGIAAQVRMDFSEPDFKAGSFYVYLDGVRDPGNVGAVIRTADAAGADAVILSPDCADIYNPKTVRSAMGSLFHIKTVVESAHLEYMKKALEGGVKAFAGALDAKDLLYDADMNGKIAVCVGNEAHGISDELKALNGVCGVKIPMIGEAESLNASVAAGILIYEAVRQRRCSL